MKLHLIGLLIVCQLISTLTVHAEDKKEIPIGVIIPLTGNTAVYGVEAKRVASLFQDMEFNGFKFNFILEDGKCGVGPEATTAGKYLIDTKKVSKNPHFGPDDSTFNGFEANYWIISISLDLSESN